MRDSAAAAASCKSRLAQEYRRRRAGGRVDRVAPGFDLPAVISLDDDERAPAGVRSHRDGADARQRLLLLPALEAQLPLAVGDRRLRPQAAHVGELDRMLRPGVLAAREELGPVRQNHVLATLDRAVGMTD